MGRGETPYELEDGDKVVFSARVIPEPTNEGQRYQAEKLLRMQGARIYDEVHVSGHLCQEGHYEMLDALQPEHVIPAHQNMSGFSGYVDLASNRGYKLDAISTLPRTETSSSWSKRPLLRLFFFLQISNSE